MSNKVQIIVKSLSNPYTAEPNPINIITYPPITSGRGISLNITYDGHTTPPTNTGNYAFEITSVDPNYTADTVTGIYSIIGNIAYQSYAVGWGDNGSSTLNINTSSAGTTGMLGVQKIVCGADFCVSLMNDNSIYTWGTGNLYGQKNIPQINNFIKDIFVSNTTTLILDVYGNLTGCGYLFNTLGNGYTGFFPRLTGISTASAADYYAIAVPTDKTHRLLAWGDASKTVFAYAKAGNITGVTQICTTNLCFIALLNNSTITGYGANVFGQLGWSAYEGTNVKKISCSDTCTSILYNNKTLIGYGYYIDSNDNLIDFNIPNPNIQGHVLDVNTSDSQSLLILDKYIPLPVNTVPPVCKDGITYA